MFLDGEEPFFQQLTDPECLHTELHRTSDRNRLYCATTASGLSQTTTLTALGENHSLLKQAQLTTFIFFLCIYINWFIITNQVFLGNLSPFGIRC